MEYITVVTFELSPSIYCDLISFPLRVLLRTLWEKVMDLEQAGEMVREMAALVRVASMVNGNMEFVAVVLPPGHVS